MSYKPPLEFETEFEKVTKEISSKNEEFVMECVMSLNIKANKDELSRALMYDRGQYRVGYSDGYEDGYGDGKSEKAQYADGYVEGYSDGKRDSHYESGHGKWAKLSRDSHFCECSKCGISWNIEEVNHCNMNYCPVCGAKMDLGE